MATLAFLGLLWLALFSLVETQQRVALARASAQIEATIRLAEENVQRAIDAATAMQELGIIETRFGPRDAAARAASPVYQELRRLVGREHFGILQVSGIGHDGRLLWSTVTPEAAGVDLSDRRHFHEPMAGASGQYIGEIMTGRVSNRPSLQISRRIENQDGAAEAVVVTSLDPLSFNTFFADLSLRPEDEAVLIHEGGMLLASSQGYHRVGQRLAADDPLLMNSRNGRTVAIAWNGGRRLVASRQVGTLPLTVAVALDEALALEAFSEHRRNLMWAGWAITAFALGLAAVLIAWLQRRGRLEQAALAVTAAQAGEDYFRTLAESLGDLVLVHDPDGRIVHASAAAARLLGEPAASLLGRRLASITHPEDRFDLQQTMALAVAAGSARSKEHRVAAAGGGWVWLETAVERIGSPDGGTARLISSSREVGVRIAAEHALREAHAQLSHLLEAAPVALYGMRQQAEDGRMAPVFVSQNLHKLLGWTAAEAMQPGWWTANTHPDDLHGARAVLQRVIDCGYGSHEYRFRTRDGDWRWLHASMRWMDDGDLDIVGSWTDVTEEHELRRQLVQASKLATLGEMATGMAHELNQPLATIGTAAENLLERCDQGVSLPATTLRPKLDRILRMTHRAAAIIDHMRVFGRLGSDSVQPVKLEAVLRGVLTIVGPRLTLMRVALVDSLQEDLPPVLGEAMLLEQVVLNLITNACDAFDEAPTPPGGRQIRITTAIAGNMAELTVHDNAGGIPDAVLPRIFQPFFTTKPAGKGTGLGLAISFGIIRDMGGSLRAENVASGARFSLMLPLASVAPVQEPAQAA